MGYSWHSYHRNPEWRRRDRRAGAASERMREVLNVALDEAPALPADKLERARGRRARYAKRNAIPPWAATPPGSWIVALGAVGLGLIVVAMVSVAVLSIMGRM